MNFKKTLSVICAMLFMIAAYGCKTADGGGKDKINIAENKFTLENEQFKLNAAYTYIDDNKTHPAVLIIAGSGPCDFDETVGNIKPLADLASALAERGVNSLRVDKRTYKYGAFFDAKDGIEEEYLSDCRAAIACLKERKDCEGVYLIGHSMGGQIASVLAAEDKDIKGMILFNSSARNIADIACDQYSEADPANKATYEKYRDAAMSATNESASGLYYYGAPDYYWITLNKVDVIALIKAAAIPTLIINSTADAQNYDEDLSLWKNSLGGDDNVTIYVDDKINHFGYEFDMTDTQAYLNGAEFDQNIASMMADFINGK